MAQQVPALPSAPDLERLILGAMMVDERAAPLVLAAMSPDDFRLEKHRRIFRAIGDLHRVGERLDRVTVGKELERRGQLQSVDGWSYLASLDDGLPEIYNLEGYIRIVREKAALRRIAIAAQTLRDRALSGAEPAAELIESAEHELRGLGPDDESDREFVALQEYLERESSIEEFLDPSRMRPTIPLPWRQLSAILGGGFRPREFVVIAGRPSHGKSAMAAAICLSACRAGRHGMFASLEMGKAEIWRRVIAQMAQVNMQVWRKGRLSDVERHELMRSTSELAELPLYVSDRPNRTVISLDAAIRRRKARGQKVDFLVVDYLQLLRSAGRHENRVQEVSEMTRDLKLLAVEHEIPVIVLSQVRRYQAEDEKPPSLSMLRESGTTEQDADIVVVIWQRKRDRDKAIEQGAPIPTRVAVEKQRNGPIGVCVLQFNPRYVRLEDDIDESRGEEI